jgi:preprotein translocase subunit SecA
MIIDFRTLHTGLPNYKRVRPILYMVYARTWFYDEVNQIGRASIDMSLDDYQSLSGPLRSLLARGYSQATLTKDAETKRVAPARNSKLNPHDPSSWGKVGRNEPCPCGSGKKYKQCHERAA